ncbi:MAG: FKBP-type peptidyl-prolyl cis-trans isomerase [Muribaculaceae bacterium]|nr:FKBP-type peptidyl-prolyl cis-trans isomerase [Muribaculaceae bacterium]MDE6299387.1 FKBP-type peptidyl-prolyl cis-trans isomerase [Muribaculaceae bacterium]
MTEEKKKEVVEPGKFVAYSYKLYNDANGQLLFETPKNAPDFMIYGVTDEIVPGLVAVLKGLAKGDKFEVVLPPEAAFGHKSPDYVMELDKEIFMRDGKLADEVKKGAKLPMMTAEGFRVEGEVIEVGDKVKMDFNHPFADLTVKYVGEVEEVRDATEEELKPRGGCCGGCGGGCGSDGDCGSDCGGGCGC